MREPSKQVWQHSLSQIILWDGINERFGVRTRKTDAAFSQGMALYHPIAIVLHDKQTFAQAPVEVRMAVVSGVVTAKGNSRNKSKRFNTSFTSG
jgi:hypothetical protein